MNIPDCIKKKQKELCLNKATQLVKGNKVYWELSQVDKEGNPEPTGLPLIYEVTGDNARELSVDESFQILELCNITTLGTYPSARNRDYTVWFGETEDMFVYAGFKINNQRDCPLVLTTTRLSRVFRFCKGCSSLEKATEEAGIVFYRYEGLPTWMESSLKRKIMNVVKYAIHPGNSTKLYDIEGIEPFLKPQ